MKRVLEIGAGILITAVGLGVEKVEAANLTGAGVINLGGAVEIRQTVIDDLGTPLNLIDDISSTSFNFLPDVGGPGQSAVTIPFLGGSGGFSSFNGTNPVNLFSNMSSLIKDTIVDGSLGPTYLSGVVNNFLELRDELGNLNGTHFNLERVDLPIYETIGTGAQALTTARLNVYGTWYDSTTNKKYKGEGVFSATFVAPSETVVLQRLRSGSGIVTAYAATIDATDIPEPGVVVGLIGVGIVGGINKKKAKV